MAEKPTLYLETTIPSYLVARPSRDVITLARQQLTQDWWDQNADHYDIHVSQLVLNEAARGDAAFARKRLAFIERFPVLTVTSEIEKLSAELMPRLQLPARAAVDCGHIAVCIHYGIDYLLTWNCAHLANADIRKRLVEFALGEGRPVTIIATPEDLVGAET